MLKRLLAITAVALKVAGCAGTLPDLGAAVKFSTVGVDNPITKKELAIINQSYLTLLRPTVAYLEMRTCRLSEDELRSWATLTPCANYDRQIVAQDALRAARQYRRQLSAFVKENKTLDAQIAYGELQKALATMRTIPKRGA